MEGDRLAAISNGRCGPGKPSPTGFTIVASTFNDPGNRLYTQTPADLLSTDTFTAIRADGPLTNISLSDPNPFSVTDLYTITAPSGCTAAAPCSFNLTINLSSVPEPAYLTILGSALMSLGWLGRRRRNTV